MREYVYYNPKTNHISILPLDYGTKPFDTFYCEKREDIIQVEFMGRKRVIAMSMKKLGDFVLIGEL